MDESEKTERLNEIAARFCEPKPTGLMGSYLPPFDTKKPNLHDSKSEFIVELKLVEEAMHQANELFTLLTNPYQEDHQLKEVCTTICDYVNLQARSSASQRYIESPADLVRRNACEIGLSYSMAHLLQEFLQGIKKRKQELKDQEAEFWSGKSRPPNHYARTIALRFARYVASGTGTKPTVGTSRDGGHPSTDFGRALEEIFQLLDISADFRRAATWAVDQLTDDDLKPVQNALGALGGIGTPNRLFGLAGYIPESTEKVDHK